MNRKLTIVGLSALMLLAVSFLAPLPGKPSLWSYLQQKNTKKHLLTYTDPVFLPDNEYRPGSTFSTYLGWDEAYEIRYVSSHDSEGVVSAYMIQFSSESTMVSQNGEGPSNEELSNIKNFAISRDGCTDFDTQNTIDYCSNDTFGYLIRTIDYYGKNYYIVETVFNGNAYLEPKTTKDFKPLLDSNEHKIIKSLLAIELKSAENYIKIDI